MRLITAIFFVGNGDYVAYENRGVSDMSLRDDKSTNMYTNNYTQ